MQIHHFRNWACWQLILCSERIVYWSLMLFDVQRVCYVGKFNNVFCPMGKNILSMIFVVTSCLNNLFMIIVFEFPAKKRVFVVSSDTSISICPIVFSMQLWSAASSGAGYFCKRLDLLGHQHWHGIYFWISEVIETWINPSWLGLLTHWIRLVFILQKFSSLGMMYAPQTVQPQHAQTAGMFAAAMLITGIFSGCLVANVLPKVITEVTW